jgi:hypothetical protein
MNKYSLARARWITAAITGDSATIKAVLKSKGEYQPDENTQPRRHTQRTRCAALAAQHTVLAGRT